jgi:hypothetical protein
VSVANLPVVRNLITVVTPDIAPFIGRTALLVGGATKKVYPLDSVVGITGLQVLDNESAGGEGGIRTLDTGVSPYNGLAN